MVMIKQQWCANSKWVSVAYLSIKKGRLFINEKGKAKLEITLAKGKKIYDKRESIKEKDQKRDIAREQSSRK